MGQLNNLIRKYESINVEEAVRVAFLKNQENYIELNLSQMLEGLTSKGTEIGQYQSELYAIEKNRINPLPGFGVVDLRYTGAFYGATTLSLKGDTIIIQSVDSKAPKLEGKYGIEIWGLMDNNRVLFIIDFLKPELVKQLGI
jgi:hypothetical protein